MSGDLWQLPPIYDNIVTDNNHLDGRPACAPSHWNEHFLIYYLTEKMRSQADPYFSSLCDRVGRGKINDEDERYLKSRIQSTELECCNDHFKNGKLSIIVTTNKKRNLINSQKLSELLPYKKEYTCNSVDRITNLPGQGNLPESLKDNPGKTGNLLTELKLKVGAPVVITTNHSKQKYREDGIVNGARGYVISIQLSKDHTDQVKVVWVVFNKESMGKLYRFDHNHLRKEFNPGHEQATPILPQRKKFTVKFGNVEYQRTNFPLSLAYAITAHKCQGETLEEVIIDFGPDLANNIKNYICPGSFYVALTRVKLGSKAFLRSFDTSYIKVNKSIEEKVAAMRKFRQYKFKKIYLDEKIFEAENDEIKIGYLNINGLLEAGHAEYLNSDKNLLNLDILALAETKLENRSRTDSINKTLNNWRIIGRYDSEDDLKHMGMMLLSNKSSIVLNQMENITHQTAKREDKLQVQGLIVRMKSGLSLGFVYSRSTPTNPEIKAICKYFDECNILMGDFNLSHRDKDDQLKVMKLCQGRKINALNEITRVMSNNQLEYILIDELMKDYCFVTSYNNFISDHKSIVARIGSRENKLKDEIKERILFHQESHSKTRNNSQHGGFDLPFDAESVNNPSNTRKKSEQLIISSFTRRIRNPDMATCWLNSCLQLILTAVDYDEYTAMTFNSELGQELLSLQSDSKTKILDPSTLKDIIVATEDVRVASRLSELSYQIFDKKKLNEKSDQINNLRLDFKNGQQCVRDFFICLNENLVSWPDVYSQFSFRLTHSTVCSSCQFRIQSETNQLYLEMSVPPNGSNLKNYLEDLLNEGSKVGLYCEGGCSAFSERVKRTSLTCSDEAKFLIIILTRGIETMDGYQLVNSKINSTDVINIR